MASAGLKKPIIGSDLFFSIIFQRDPKFKLSGTDSAVAPGKLRKSLEKSSEKMLAAIWSDPKITINQLANLFGLSGRAVEKRISVLREQGKLVRIGSRRAGYWQVRD